MVRIEVSNITGNILWRLTYALFHFDEFAFSSILSAYTQTNVPGLRRTVQFVVPISSTINESSDAAGIGGEIASTKNGERNNGIFAWYSSPTRGSTMESLDTVSFLSLNCASAARTTCKGTSLAVCFNRSIFWCTSSIEASPLKTWFCMCDNLSPRLTPTLLPDPPGCTLKTETCISRTASSNPQSLHPGMENSIKQSSGYRLMRYSFRSRPGYFSYSLK